MRAYLIAGAAMLIVGLIGIANHDVVWGGFFAVLGALMALGAAFRPQQTVVTFGGDPPPVAESVEAGGGSSMSSAKPIIVRTYKGSQSSAAAAFERDAAKLAGQGYVPISQSWAQGSWGCGAFLIALLLAIVIIGILIFIYMLLVKPAGTLTVTYEYRRTASDSATSEQ